MTSVKSSANKKAASYDLKRAFKQCAVPAIFVFVLLVIAFVLEPGRTVLGFLDAKVPVPKNIIITALAPEWEGLPVFLAILGAVLAVLNMYIMTKPSVNFHLSLPVNRKTLFWNRYCATAALTAAVLAVAIGIDLVMNISVFGHPAFQVKMALSVYAEALVYLMASYTVVTLGIFSTYTIVEGLFFGAALFMLPSVLIVCFDLLCDSLLNGYARAPLDGIIYAMGESFVGDFYKAPLFAALAIANPLTLGNIVTAQGDYSSIFKLANSSANYDVFLDTDTLGGTEQVHFEASATLPSFDYYVPLLVWTALIVLLAVLACYLFVHRKAEKTAIHASNPVATHIFAMEAGLVGVMVCSVFMNLAEDSLQTLPIIIAVYAVAFLAVNLVVLAVSKRQVIFKDKKAYLASVSALCCLVAVSAVLASGGLGYTAYAPKAEEISLAVITNSETAEITMGESVNFYDYPGFGYDYGAIGIFEELEDIEMLLKLKDGIVADRETKNAGRMVNIVYLTKSGKRIHRSYDTKAETATEAALACADSTAYKKELKSILLGEDQSEYSKKIQQLGLSELQFIKELQYNDVGKLNGLVRYVYAEGTARLTAFNDPTGGKEIENSEKLRLALAEDLCAADYRQLCQAEEKELCRITFSPSAKEFTDENGDIYTYDSVYSVRTYPVYPFMKNTVQYLTEKGLLKGVGNYFSREPEAAYYATVESYTSSNYFYGRSTPVFKGGFSETYGDEEYYEEVYNDIDRVLHQHTEDRKEIKKLMQSAKPNGFLSEDDYIVAFRLRDSNGILYYLFMCIPKEKME